MWRAAAALARCLPGEAAHIAAVQTLRFNIGPKPTTPSLPVKVVGLDFDNPLGLAAGFDKNAECYAGAMRLGFGHVEVGTITPLAQAGNARPRVFRLPEDGAVINRYGFNGKGMEVAAKHLATGRPKTGDITKGVLGVNVGANKTSPDPIADYHMAVARLASLADYVTLNISSPNTPGLRDLQADQMLQKLLAAGRSGMAESGTQIPLFLKMAPDLAAVDIGALVDRCASEGVDGIIATNTTISRPENLRSAAAKEHGGLSGMPLFEMSTKVLAEVCTTAQGQMAVIGVGGVASGWQAYAKILVGADLVQLYSGLALQGPLLPQQILAELAVLLARDGCADLAAVKGQIPDAKKAISHSLLLAQNA
ncbi:quinone-dependent dihydroorotate dehydrogenase [Alphaproteobacteria bacterium]|nr:quinone-dependent dihydroorotate dehydrogenase [Alphaproteobacteria bacterium]